MTFPGKRKPGARLERNSGNRARQSEESRQHVVDLAKPAHVVLAEVRTGIVGVGPLAAELHDANHPAFAQDRSAEQLLNRFFLPASQRHSLEHRGVRLRRKIVRC